jgi:hypothetical protein
MKRMVLIPEEKLMQYEQQKGGVINITPYTPNTGWSTPPTPQYGYGKKEEERELSDDITVRGIPKTMRTRASALLERLKARPDIISWDDMGQVKIDGVFIPKSNISDLISNAMRSRKNFNPIASQEFFNVLNNLNVPRDLVRNEESMNKRKKPVTQKGGFGGTGTFMAIGDTIFHLVDKMAHGGARYMANRERKKKRKKTKKTTKRSG